MDHSRQRRTRLVHPGQHPVDGGRVGHVGQFHVHIDALREQCLDGVGRVGIGGAAPVQHDGARAPFRQPSGHRAADPAQPAGHQVGPVGAQPSGRQRRQGQDVLADVAGCLHELHRGRGFRHRPEAMDRRLELARRQPGRHRSEGVSGPLRVGLLQRVQLQDRVGDVSTGGGHLVGAHDVAAPELHEASAGTQARQARLDEALPGEAVQHDVDAFASGGFEDVGAEGGVAAVEDVLHSQRPQERLLGRAGGGQDLGARGPGQFDGGQTHPSGGGVDQHTLADGETGRLERQRSRGEDQR